MRKKKYIIVAISFIVFVIVFLIITSGTWKSRYNHYLEKIPGSELFMPNLDELGDYDDIDVRYKNTWKIIFNAKSIALYVTYDDSEYEIRKTALFEQYTLLVEPVVRGDSYLMPEVVTVVNGYYIYVVDNTEGYEEYIFPKKFGMIGFNDDTNELVYLFFYDIDLDLISLVENGPEGKLASFIQRYFKLKT